MFKKVLMSITLGFLTSLCLVEISLGQEEVKGSRYHSISEKENETIGQRLPALSTAFAKAEIKGTQDGSKITGIVAFTETDEGVIVKAKLNNVPDPGKHGFHIHENGSCDKGGKAAGGHYNPANAKHGNLSKDGIDNAHAGDMGNIEIDEDGYGFLQIHLPGLSLTGGKYNILGRAVILHAKEDDFSEPTGNAGARIGCGIISTEVLTR